MKAGELRWNATIQSPPVTQLASGAPDPSAWVTVATRRCEVEDISASKTNDGVGQEQLTSTFEVTMRYTPGILTSYRVTIAGYPYDGMTLRVVYATNDLTETVLTCVLRTNSQ